MNKKDATRGLSQASVANQTEFQMHSLHSNHDTHHVIDWSEHKLKRYITTVTDFQQRMVLTKIMSEYTSGKVAIAWRAGWPVYIRVTKA